MELGERTEAPAKFHLFTAVSTIAGALRRRVYIDERTFKIYPNHFIWFVAPPGVVQKSTTMSIGMNMLRELEFVKFSADIATWQGFITDLASSREDFECAPGEFMPQCAITMAISELGNFIRKDDHDMINILTDLWDSKDGPFTKMTKTQGSDEIVNPYVNMIGATTPRWMQMNFRNHFGGWGLSSRILFVYGEEKARLVPRPSKAIPAAWWKDHVRKLGEDLLSIADLVGSYELTPEADELSSSWYLEHNVQHRNLNQREDTDEWLSYFYARKHIHINKMAMVFAASRRNDLIIERKDFQDAINLFDKVEEDMGNIFGRPVQMDRAELNNDIWKELKKKLLIIPRIPERQFFQYCLKYMDTYNSARQFMDHLQRAGMISKEVETGISYIKLGDFGGLSS